MRAVLLRHGQAQPRTPGGSDRERPLTPEGRAQAAAIGRLLRARGLLPDGIVSSPAPRARETARLAAQAAGAQAPLREEAALYEAEGSAIVAVLERHATATASPTVPTLWVVGHNPGLEDAAALLGGREVRLGVACAAVLEGRRLLEILAPPPRAA